MLCSGIYQYMHGFNYFLWWQARYTAGTKEILRRFFDNIPLNPTDVIVAVGCAAP